MQFSEVGSVQTLILGAGIGAVGIMQRMIITRIGSMEKSLSDVAKKVVGHDVTLFGETKQNGLNGRMNDAEEAIGDLRQERRHYKRRASDREE